MAKRANPFVEDFIPQSKIHVGLKQLNNNDDRLKKVYEKTLELLFKGAKKCPPLDGLNDSSVRNISKDDRLKQLFIGKDGSLLHTGCMVKSNSREECKCGAAVESRCAYCEAALCRRSRCKRDAHRCERCEGAFCSRCILSGSEGAVMCVSCYS